MSARRAARAKPDLVTCTERGEIPTALLVGRCVEVWADPTDSFDVGSARIRFGSARDAWLLSRGISDADGWSVIPDGAPWRLAEDDGEHLARVGCSTADIPALRAQADQLFAHSQAGDKSLARAYRRHKQKGFR